MKCPRCGSENAGVARFCGSCGSPLVVSVQTGSTQGIEGRLAKYFSASPKLLKLLPFSSKISGLLDLDLIRTINPIVLFVPVAFTFLLGLSPSAFGHIENSPFLFQALPIISVFNPFLGYLSAIAFAVGDIIQKLLYDDVYYGGSPTVVDYVGARIGFMISYSSVVTFGVLPGVLARVFRNFMTRRQMQGRPLDGGTATTIASIIPFVLGGAIGAAISGVAAIGLEMPSFYMRQSPDVSCANVMVNTNIQNTIPTSAASGFVGGIVGPIASSTIPKIFPPTTGQAGQTSGIDRLPEKLDWKNFGKGVRFPGVRALGDSGGPTVKGVSDAGADLSYTRSPATEQVDTGPIQVPVERVVSPTEQQPSGIPETPTGPTTLDRVSTGIKATEDATETVKEASDKAGEVVDALKRIGLISPETVEKIGQLKTGVEKAIDAVNRIPWAKAKAGVDFWNEWNKATAEVKKTYDVDSKRASNIGFWDTVVNWTADFTQDKVTTISDGVKKGAKDLRDLGVIKDETYQQVEGTCNSAKEIVPETKKEIYDKVKDKVVPKKGEPAGHAKGYGADSDKMMDSVFGRQDGGPPPGSKWDIIKDEWVLPDEHGVYKIRTGIRKPPQ